METTKPTVIDLYFSYWKTHIQSIEEEKRRVHFNELLIDVGIYLYGPDFGLELAFLFLKAQSPDRTGAGRKSDLTFL